MKRISVIAVCITLLICSSLWASPRTGQRPEGICTSDFNIWGHSSQCSCEQGAIYDQRAGLCLEDGEAAEVTIQGAVSVGLAAIGGETTGFEIKTKDEKSFELILKAADQEKLSTLDGMWFEITGELIVIKGVERKERNALIAEQLGVLE